MYKRAGILIAIAVLGIGCQQKPEIWEDVDIPPVPEEFADLGSLPLVSEVTDVQPMTGHVLWDTNPHCADWPVQLEFAYMLYNDVCSRKGVFDWTPMDRLLEKAASRGHQVVVRFRYTYVGEECAVPEWIKALPDYEETVGKSEGETTHFPDWRCEELEDFHMEFHRRFAERYDKDPRLAFVETGFGLWAEYHIYDGPFILGRTFPSKDFQSRFLKAMGEWFKDCPWCISIDAADGAYSPLSSQSELLGVRFGNFDDSFMCADHDGYNRESWLFFGKDRYKTAPFGGEFSYFKNFDQKHCLDASGLYGRVFEDEVRKYHMTFIISNDQPEYQSVERFKESAMSMGYKFRISDFRVKDGKAAICVANVGVAPVYRDAFVAVNGVRTDWSLRNLMPRESRWLTLSDESVRTDNCSITIECDHLVKDQKIQFSANIK